MKIKSVINLQYTTIKKPLPNFIYQDLKEFSQKANLYRPQPLELIEKLSQKHKLPKEMFYLVAGCDEALQMFIITYGKKTVVFTPTYTVYSDVEVFGGKLNKVYSIIDDEYQINPQKYKQANLIILANPNNPSGYTEKEKVIKLIKNNNHAIVVIDEAYGEFAPELSVINLVKKYKNLAVLRSFSKDYGMAGNRVGYIIANNKLINSIKDKTQWSNISYLSVGAAISALNHEKYFIKIREDIHTQREKFISFLKEAGFTVLPSKINAVLIKFNTEREAVNLIDFLKKHHIVVSHGNGASNIGLDLSFVRIAIGTLEQMTQVTQAINEFKKSNIKK
ncbi:histidinol-phosphate aminotransferase family protein [Candidatus Microgenomates bacterium]|nr:histidinol-phosphate aminotransferase family protein [Candidatus Microgenomates bacterium]